jgi:CheY-like chemotaxis protein
LMFFATDEDKFAQSAREVETKDFFDEITKLADLVRRNKNSSFEYFYDRQLPKRLRLHDGALAPALLNILSNANKFSDRTSVQVNISFGDDRLLISVQDFGIGIAEAEIAKIFRPFYQVEARDNRRFGGVGLGLAIAKRLVDAVGGSISVKSELGRGSVFSLAIPVQSVESRSAEPLEAKARDDVVTRPNGSAHTSRPYVLIAEDNVALLELITLYLGDLAIDIEGVENGKEALDRVMTRKRQGLPVSLVLMDLQMPIVDGMSATKFLRRRGLDMPIVAVTAHIQKYFADQCMQAGFTNFLAKPYDKVLLKRMVTSYCRLEDGDVSVL